MSRGSSLIIKRATSKDDNALYRLVKEIKGCSIMQAMSMLGTMPLVLVENDPDTAKVQEWARRLKELEVEYELTGDAPSTSSSSASAPKSSSSSGGSGSIIVTGVDREKNYNENEIYKLIKKIRGCSITEAMSLFGSMPFTLVENASAAQIDEWSKQLKDLYVLIEVKGGDASSSASSSSSTSAPKPANKPSTTSSSSSSSHSGSGGAIYVTGIESGKNENEIYKAFRKIRGCSMSEAMSLLTDIPFTLVEDAGKNLAEYEALLKEVGVQFEIRGGGSSSAPAPQPTYVPPAEEPSPVDEYMDEDESEEGQEEGPEQVVSSAEQKLESMIGLTAVKREVEKIKAYIYKNQGEKINCHMFFLGNPGTGKTVVARLMGDILHSAGVLPTNNFVECSAKDLISPYIGGTADQTGKMVEKAMGGILYIDEAYSLNPKENQHGKECVDALIKLMEDKRGEFCCIFAGYTEEMQELLDANPGFDSRVKFKILFEDYTKPELKQIAADFIKSKKYEVSEEILNRIIDIVDMNRYSKNFGNARTARTVVESIMLIQAVRTKKDRKDRTITMEDVERYCEDNDVKLVDPETAGTSDARTRLNELVGLTSVKETIDDLISYFTMNKGRKIDFHMAFMGNPGTGKTVVARLVGEMLHEEGLLPSSKLLEVTSSDMIAQYVGQTAPKTKALIQKAMGGVLFVDEAYTLAGGKGASFDFGSEAIMELLKAMEDRRGDFCVILAGYTKEMHDLFAVNPGLQSRVKFELEFPDYNVDELKAMAKMYLKKDGYEVSDEDLDVLVNYSYSLKNEKNYANARTLREVLSKVEIKQAGRVRKSDPTNRVLTIEDMEKALDEKKIKLIVDLLKNGPQALESNDGPLAPMVDINKLRDDYAHVMPQPFEKVQSDIAECVVAIYNESKDGKGESSGFIISDNGYVATCAHCVRNSVSLKVRHRVIHRSRHIDTYYDAQVVAISEENDTAIIKMMTDEKFLFVPMAPEDVEDLKPLSHVFLMGYPFGVSRFDEMSVNEGKIASYQRNMNGPDQINLDISAKSGNSGSCVIDGATGQVIGVLCGSSTSQSGALVEEINYCRPISYIWDLIKGK